MKDDRSLQQKDFYTRQEAHLLKEFDRMVRKVKEPIIARYGNERADAMIIVAREEYRRLLPELPYVGGKQPFTQFVISSGWFLAFHRVMQTYGADVHETGSLVYLLSQTYLEKVPGFARQLLGYVSFSPSYLRNLRKRAEASQKNPYPRGYIASYVEGDGVNFDFGVDYHRCATLNFLSEKGAGELNPYLCACDYIYSELLGWGLTRTTTLAEGGEVCNFRFKKGGPTRINSTVIDFGAIR
jgi:L-2-amino-thiazoline-4-carboxylic acid hydrolase